MTALRVTPVRFPPRPRTLRLSGPWWQELAKGAVKGARDKALKPVKDELRKEAQEAGKQETRKALMVLGGAAAGLAGLVVLIKVVAK